jgi:hypothetical protein
MAAHEDQSSAANFLKNSGIYIEVYLCNCKRYMNIDIYLFHGFSQNT